MGRNKRVWKQLLSVPHNTTRWVKVFATVIAPLIEVIATFVLSQGGGFSNPAVLYGTLFFVLFVILHFVSAFLVFYNDSTNYSLLLSQKRLKKKLKIRKRQNSDLISGIKSLVNTLEIFKYITGGVNFLNSVKLQEKTLKVQQIKDLLERLLNPIYTRRHEIFETDGDDLLNMVIYLFNEDDNELQLFFRRADDRIPKKNRSWKVGFGHIGKTFLYKQALICTDVKLTKASINETFGMTTENDDRYYRSFISVPILRSNDNGEDSDDVPPIGVLAFTSSKADHFTKAEHESFLWILSNLLSIFFESAEQTLTTEKLTHGCYVGLNRQELDTNEESQR